MRYSCVVRVTYNNRMSQIINRVFFLNFILVLIVFDFKSINRYIVDRIFYL